MDLERVALHLIGLSYEACTVEGGWDAFVRQVSRALCSPTVNLALQEVPCAPGRWILTVGSYGLDAAFSRSYHEYYGDRNPVLERRASNFQQGRVYRDEELCPRHLLYRTEFFNDWVSPQHMNHALFHFFLKSERHVAFTNIVRYRGAKPFTDDEVRLLSILSPHLRNSMDLFLQVAELQSGRQLTGQALDAWSVGVIIVDAKGVALYANRASRAMLDSRDGLYLTGKVLCAARAGESLQLRRLIAGAEAATSLPLLPLRRGGTVVISRPSHKRGYEILVAPARQQMAFHPSRGAAAILFVRDPESHDLPDTGILRSLYLLTQAEAEIAVLLMNGEDLKTAMDLLRITRNTAKTHLSHIFQKTGTTRQAELIGFLLRGPAALSALISHEPPLVRAKAS